MSDVLGREAYQYKSLLDDGNLIFTVLEVPDSRDYEGLEYLEWAEEGTLGNKFDTGAVFVDDGNGGRYIEISENSYDRLVENGIEPGEEFAMTLNKKGNKKYYNVYYPNFDRLVDNSQRYEDVAGESRSNSKKSSK